MMLLGWNLLRTKNKFDQNCKQSGYPHSIGEPTAA